MYAASGSEDAEGMPRANEPGERGRTCDRGSGSLGPNGGEFLILLISRSVDVCVRTLRRPAESSIKSCSFRK